MNMNSHFIVAVFAERFQIVGTVVPALDILLSEFWIYALYQSQMSMPTMSIVWSRGGLIIKYAFLHKNKFKKYISVFIF